MAANLNDMANNQASQAKSPTLIFIFGGSGDLTYRKLMPALYNLYLDKYLPEQFAIVGIGRSVFSNSSFRTHTKEGIEKHSRRPGCIKIAWKEFSLHIEYVKADLENDRIYKTIGSRIKKGGRSLENPGDGRLLYVGSPPAGAYHCRKTSQGQTHFQPGAITDGV